MEAFFAVAGKVADIKRGAQEDGRPLGWAHVQFEEVECVAEACRLNGSVLMGRPLYVDAAGE